MEYTSADDHHHPTDAIGEGIADIGYYFLALDIVVHVFGCTSLAPMEDVEGKAPPRIIANMAGVQDIYYGWQRIRGYTFSLHFWVDIIVLLGYVLVLSSVHAAGDDTIKSRLLNYEKTGDVTVSARLMLVWPLSALLPIDISLSK